MNNTDIAEQIMMAAKADQELRFQINSDIKDDALWDKIAQVDSKNTQLMISIVEQIGWPTISKVGDKASQAAWLLVQHADKERDFQKRCLELMEKAKRDIRLANIAFLTDRIRMSEGQHQLYGTQFIPATGKPLTYIPYKIEDPDNVAARRRTMGLNTLEENAAEINQRKPGGTKQSSLDN